MRNEWERLESDKIIKSCKSGTVALDIGANIGIYSVILSKCVGDNGHVYAFEPDSENYEYLSNNTIKLNNVTIKKSAVGDCDGTVKMLKSKDHKGDHKIYFNENSDKDLLVEVESIRLNTFLKEKAIDPKKIGVIKIDTQGAEPFILHSLGEDILKFENATLFVEFTPMFYEAMNIDSKKYLSFLFENFSVDNLNYVSNEYFHIESKDQLFGIYESYNKIENNLDHSTLVLSIIKTNIKVIDLDFLVQS